MNRSLLILAVLVLLASPVWCQSSSYIDAVYQVYEDANASDPVEVLKNSIKTQFDIEIADDPDVNRWSKTWLDAVNTSLTALPASFRSATRMIYLDPSNLDFEVKYNGFNDQHGIVQMGYGSMFPSSVYTNKFKATYKRMPTSAEKIARFKYILARGMAYSFIQENPDVFKAYGRAVTYGTYSTKVYGPGAELNMIVLPGKNPLMIDLAFAIGEYCAAPTSLKSKSQARFDFVKNNVMGGATISGWGYMPVDDAASSTTDPGDDPGNVETPTASGAPEIPDGDYLPIVTEVDVGTAAAGLPAEWKTAPDLLKSAIVELFEVLPKFFSTCTQAIAYLPTTDTETAFSSEGFIFITQNSWFMPSFVELDDAARGKRFKETLLREMTLRFLYYHPEVTTKWKDTFDKSQSSSDAYVDMQQAVIGYFGAKDWLKQVNNARYNFIKNEFMKGKEF
ncbi:MAG TPA: hypothetical protein DCG57_21385 [Candidatus Riflebacteria bacterium]|nr:hypothetical protein [Candidatus Riflebacteria bacterium]